MRHASRKRYYGDIDRLGHQASFVVMTRLIVVIIVRLPVGHLMVGHPVVGLHVALQ